MSVTQHLTFDELVDTAQARGLCVELRDDGVVRTRRGAEYRNITEIRVTRRPGRGIVLQYPVRGYTDLDTASAALLPRLPAP